MAIVYAQATYLERKDQTLEGLRRIHDHVDRCVVISSEPVEDWSELKQFPKVEYFQEPWTDNFPVYRNKYLEKLSPNDWAIVADPDEWFSDSFCQDLRGVIEQAEKQGIGLLLINSHDFFEQEDGKVEERISNFFKNLCFKYAPEVHYEGVGETKNVHETLLFPPGTKQATLPRKYYYEHHKTWLEEKERAFRNVFISGGGNNAGTINPRWLPLQSITDRLGLKSWSEVRAYLRRGNIDKELLQWIIECKDQCGWDWQNEMQDSFRFYKRLHPTELEGFEIDLNLKPMYGSPPEVMHYVEQCYLEILGRHADTGGKAGYTNAILTGKIKREDLPSILKSSDEYKQKFGVAEPEGERVSVAVPVNVDVRVGEDSFVRALMKSRTYWEKIRPKLELADKWNRLLNVARKVETCGKGVDESPLESFVPFAETFAHHCPPDKYHTILDIGAGCGSQTKVLSDKGFKVVGITFGEDNIQYAKEKYGIDLLEMDMHNLQFPDNFFDGAFLIQTFEHAFSPWLFIIELRRILRDGGRVFIDVPDPDDGEMLKTIWHPSVLYPNQIKALFWKAGFKEVVDLSQKHRLAFLFEKIPDNQFEMWGYIKHIMGKA